MFMECADLARLSPLSLDLRQRAGEVVMFGGSDLNDT
ncbi:MAG: hypothetical protein ACI835_004306 [Planctomycetota bacterium]|jgi:hypothetical protein